MLSLRKLVLISAVGLGAIAPAAADAAWSCAKCHGTTTPRAAPSAARLDSLTTYSEWTSKQTATVGTRYMASYEYAVKCQTTATQYVVTYPDDPNRRDYLYMYNPATNQHWARCNVPGQGQKAEWSFYNQTRRSWSEEKFTNIRIPGTQRKAAEPPEPPLPPL